MRTDWLKAAEMEHLLAALMPHNRLALEIAMATGLRISDVLGLRADVLRERKDRRINLREMKTGKRKRITLPVELHRRALALAGRVYVFEHRTDWRKPRTRQAVYKDLKRVAKMFRLTGNIAPHSTRKIFAVDAYKRTGDLQKVQTLLNHSSAAVTALYAMADELAVRNFK